MFCEAYEACILRLRAGIRLDSTMLLALQNLVQRAFGPLLPWLCTQDIAFVLAVAFAILNLLVNSFFMGPMDPAGEGLNRGG